MDLEPGGVLVNDVEALDILINSEQFPELARALAVSFVEKLNTDRVAAAEAFVGPELYSLNKRVRARAQEQKERILKADGVVSDDNVDDLLDILGDTIGWDIRPDEPGKYRLPQELGGKIVAFCAHMAAETGNKARDKQAQLEKRQAEREGLNQQRQVRGHGWLWWITRDGRETHRSITNLDIHVEYDGFEVRAATKEYNAYRQRTLLVNNSLPEAERRHGLLWLVEDPLKPKVYGDGRQQV